MLEKNEKIYDILVGVFKKHDYNLDANVLIKELNNYQSKNDCYFSYPRTAEPCILHSAL